MRQVVTDWRKGPPPVFHHDGIPTYEECRQLIREEAYRLSEAEGHPPNRGVEFWLQAERDLFYQQENYFLYGGYKIYVVDETKPKVAGYYSYYEVGIVTPIGYVGSDLASRSRLQPVPN